MNVRILPNGVLRRDCFKGQISLEEQRLWGPELEGDTLESQLGPSPRRSKKEARRVSRGRMGGVVERLGVLIMSPPCRVHQGFKRAYLFPIALASQENPMLYYNDFTKLSCWLREVKCGFHKVTQ